MSKKKFNLERFSSLLVKGRWITLGVFFVLIVFCIIMIFNTDIIYDLSSYTPKGSHTEQALSVMKSEFDDKGSCYVMVNNIDEEEALSIQDELSSLAGIAMVSFDAHTDYKDKSALYTIMLSSYDATPEAHTTIKSILKYLDGKEAYLSGQSAFSYYTRLETEESIMKVGIVIVIAILLMLLFTSKTYFEIVIMILVFGSAIILNMGTNFLFNGISYVSNLIALVLQLALSIDYSVILLHRFMEEREKNTVRQSIVLALSKGTKEILSSSLTTIAGLCALMLMTLPIGVEMGFALAKSILASLASVIFLMPALLMFFAKPMEKTRHKSFVPSIKTPARAILKARYFIVPIFVVLIILAGVAQSFNKYSFSMNASHRIVDANQKIGENFGYLNDLVVIVPKGDYETEKQLADYTLQKELINKATGLANIEIAEGVMLTDRVTSTELLANAKDLGIKQVQIDMLYFSYIRANDPNTQIPQDEYSVPIIDLLVFGYDNLSALGMEKEKELLEPLILAKASFTSEQYSRIMLNINSSIESEKSLELIGELYEELGEFYEEFYILGESVVCHDVSIAFQKDNTRVTLFTAAFVLLILLFTFKNLVIPILLVLAIQGGMWINFALPFIMGDYVSFVAFLLISAIQMGATIDYAIVLTNRYKELKATIPDKKEAMVTAQNAVYATIITSGTILSVTGLAMGFLASGMVANMGALLGVGAAISALIVLLVLPSILLVADKLAEKADFSNLIKNIKKKKTKKEDS